MRTFNSTETLQIRQLFERSVDSHPNNIALISDEVSLSYQALEERCNQLAHYLLHQGLKPQHSVGIVLERSLDSYIAILAVLKTGAAYVPIETDYPDDRINYILSDMSCQFVLSSSIQSQRICPLKSQKIVVLDKLKSDIARKPCSRPELTAAEFDQLAYVIYTSGSTGQAKGVEITQRSICHYVMAASELYQIRSDDRIYQGFSLAFDASLEELWMAFANAATLVACQTKDTRSGLGLIEFLNDHRISVFSTVPSLLSSIEGDLPHLRLLILGGEVCSTNLINRWSRSGLRILNTYGPTEATVISTFAECVRDEAVTIGKPLAGYEVLILDEQLHPLADGTAGELCIAGCGLARAYVNQAELTAQKFIAHPYDASQRLYRSGDLAMINDDGNIVFMGRIDEQVKLRGFRIELNEIEHVMMQQEGVNQAVVALQALEQATLVAYLRVNASFDLEQFKHCLQQRLPHYMLPALYEIVSVFPVLSSGKVDRKSLPKPTKSARFKPYIAASSELERHISTVWVKHLKHQAISIEEDFFYDLGGHSLTAATIVSHLRKIPVMHSISMLDLYQNPTIKQLAEKFRQSESDIRIDETPTIKHKPIVRDYYLCAIGQFLGCLFQYALGAWQMLALIFCYAWVRSVSNDTVLTSLCTLLALVVSMPIISMLLTLASKWILLGKVKPGIHKLWGAYYFRWWLAMRLQATLFPAANLIGTPLLPLYYRLLGAKIGKNCYIGTASLAMHDLISVGNNSAIGFDARLQGYVIEDGWLKIGSVSIGEDCFVGARSVLGINTSMGDQSCLDDMSMLPADGHIPAQQFYAGSPACQSIASPEHISKQPLSLTRTSAFKNIGFAVMHYFCMIFVTLVYYACFYPAFLLIEYVYRQGDYLLTVLFAAPLGAILFLSLYYLSIACFKKVLMNKINPGIYSLHSFYYLRQWTVVKLLDTPEVGVMGDTLYLPHFLRILGAKLGSRVEMGENPHIIPDLISIDDEGFTASGVALALPSVYRGCIMYAPVEVGKRGFVGNYSLLPLGERIGDEGLLGCMSITPPNHQAAVANTAWLGSPAMFLPKREEFTEYTDKDKFYPSKRLIKLRLAIEFVKIILPTSFSLLVLINLYYVLDVLFEHSANIALFCLFPIANMFINIGLVAIVVLLKWLLLGKLKPTVKPIWDPFIWKCDVIGFLYSYFVETHFVNLVLGTPFAAILFRSLGAKIGKRVFIDTGDLCEFDLTSIGDDVCLNYQALIQTHLYEDRIFKMSSIHIDNGCNIGVASIVLYSTVMEQNVTLGDFSLLMKGECLPARTSWQGIPAQHKYTQTRSQTINPASSATPVDDSFLAALEQGFPSSDAAMQEHRLEKVAEI